MTKWLRALLLCMLALAVPVHGAVAARMLVCKGAMQQPVPSQAAEHADCPHHQVVAEQLAGPDEQEASDLDHATCGACSVCGTASALIPDWPVAADAERLGVHVSSESACRATFVTGGPDRPPRAHLT